MIVAKAENTELIVFVKDGNHWNEITQATPFYEHNNYFLCLPQHKEAVLNSLNGGVAQFESPREKGDHALEQADWSSSEWYMQSDATSRIKPKKEKRWVIECNGALLSTRLFTSESSAQQSVGESGYSTDDVQFIEIEVKVTGQRL